VVQDTHNIKATIITTRSGIKGSVLIWFMYWYWITIKSLTCIAIQDTPITQIMLCINYIKYVLITSGVCLSNRPIHSQKAPPMCDMQVYPFPPPLYSVTVLQCSLKSLIIHQPLFPTSSQPTTLSNHILTSLHKSLHILVSPAICKPVI